MSGGKITILGGGGARTPLLIHGLAEAGDAVGVAEIALFDIDRERAAIMAALGREIIRDNGAAIEITTPPWIEDAIEGARFVSSSVRVGGIEARARDERIVLEHGFAGQETTGPGGLAMALRTIPVALEQARLIERLAPDAWLVNFTNPAGLITQALTTHTRAHVVGICDTPAEVFHRIAWSLGLPFEQMRFEYAGLNHLGWVRRVLLRGEDITSRLLSDDEAIRRVYPAPLFEPALVRTLGLIPTEYLFFYYGRSRAVANQRKSGATRGEEIQQMNDTLFAALRDRVRAGDARGGLAIYKDYLNQRNASYMRLEAAAQSGLKKEPHDWNPFEGATGYHRIAVEVMTALNSESPKVVVVNVRNRGAITDLAPDDVVEVPAAIDLNGPRPLATGALPSSVKGLVLAVKAYERLAIRAAVEQSMDLARLALLAYPIVGEWQPAAAVLDALAASDPEYLGYLRQTTPALA